MPIVVASRRKKLALIETIYPGALLLDVTSKGSEPWVQFSPFYPHGSIPIPNSPGAFAQSVEGLWQGLKVFEREDIDPGKWAIKCMSGIKRSGKARGAVLGHRFGIANQRILGYLEARLQIYLPAYKWVLDNKLAQQVRELKTQCAMKTLVLLDYETNGDIQDLSRPLSHAALVKHYLEDSWPSVVGSLVAEGEPAR
ncbi:MAG: DUF6939 family protein [Pirellulaceae bacterium]